MGSYARFLGSWEKPSRSLVSEFEAYGAMLTTDYVRYLMEEMEAVVSNVRQLVELSRTQKLGEFVASNVALRRRGDAQKDPILVLFAKLLNNSR